MTAKINVTKVGSFYIHTGITPKQIRQLIAFTKAEKGPMTRDKKRFMSKDQYEKWADKGRTIYTVTDSRLKDGNLRGIFWMGEKLLPERPDYKEYIDPNFYRYTFALRLYGPARGKGLSQLVLDECVRRFISNLTLPIGVWLETDKENAISLRMAQKEGARIVSGFDQSHVILVKEYSK